MARKTVGFVHLEWECPSCNTRNKGTDRVCINCSAPMPDDVQFQQLAQEKLIENEAIIAAAKAGADIHCAFCGTRNPATATHCSQCMADLSEGAQRHAGKVVGAHRTRNVPDVNCSHCGSVNPGTASACSQCGAPLPGSAQKIAPAQPSRTESTSRRKTSPILYLIGFAFLALCAVIVFLNFRTEEIVGQVDEVEWTTSMSIEGLVPVRYEEWFDRIPSDGNVLSCSSEVRRVSSSPVENSVEVCGTPYTVDTGSGVGQVVQDCEYEVYDDYCAYTVEEWREVDVFSLTGTDFDPELPALALDAGQREGVVDEDYVVKFAADGRTYTYEPRDYDEFLQFEAESRWILEINSFNSVVSVSPDR